jgi:hypothetical protein
MRAKLEKAAAARSASRLSIESTPQSPPPASPLSPPVPSAAPASPPMQSPASPAALSASGTETKKLTAREKLQMATAARAAARAGGGETPSPAKATPSTPSIVEPAVQSTPTIVEPAATSPPPSLPQGRTRKLTLAELAQTRGRAPSQPAQASPSAAPSQPEPASAQASAQSLPPQQTEPATGGAEAPASIGASIEASVGATTSGRATTVDSSFRRTSGSEPEASAPDRRPSLPAKSDERAAPPSSQDPTNTQPEPQPEPQP